MRTSQLRAAANPPATAAGSCASGHMQGGPAGVVLLHTCSGSARCNACTCCARVLHATPSQQAGPASRPPRAQALLLHRPTGVLAVGRPPPAWRPASRRSRSLERPRRPHCNHTSPHRTAPGRLALCRARQPLAIAASLLRLGQPAAREAPVRQIASSPGRWTPGRAGPAVSQTAAAAAASQHSRAAADSTACIAQHGCTHQQAQRGAAPLRRHQQWAAVPCRRRKPARTAPRPTRCSAQGSSGAGSGGITGRAHL